jgi:hypothetical protein
MKDIHHPHLLSSINIPSTLYFEVFFSDRYPYIDHPKFDFSKSGLGLLSLRFLMNNLFQISNEASGEPNARLEDCLVFVKSGQRDNKGRPQSLFIDNDDADSLHPDSMLREGRLLPKSADILAIDVDSDSDASSNGVSSLALFGANIGARYPGKEERAVNVPYPRLCQGVFCGCNSSFYV